MALTKPSTHDPTGAMQDNDEAKMDSSRDGGRGERCANVREDGFAFKFAFAFAFALEVLGLDLNDECASCTWVDSMLPCSFSF